MKLIGWYSVVVRSPPIGVLVLGLLGEAPVQTKFSYCLRLSRGYLEGTTIQSLVWYSILCWAWRCMGEATLQSKDGCCHYQA